MWIKINSYHNHFQNKYWFMRPMSEWDSQARFIRLFWLQTRKRLFRPKVTELWFYEGFCGVTSWPDNSLESCHHFKAAGKQLS